MTETEACIALNLVPKMGPVRLRNLLEVFESPTRVLGARAGELQRAPGIDADLAQAVSHWEEHTDLPGELRKISDFGAHVLTRQSTEYPRELQRIHNPPIVLYVWGKLQESDHRAIGVVGSRQTSHYGLECAKKLSYQLAYAGLTVVSGLARGIDTAAHQGALAAKGRTVAVIGSGLMNVYPPENAGLAEKIAASGAVISEFPMQFPPSPQTFPYRNRIVAGWGSGVLVVEAGMKSGALITANQALEQGRSIYAVPGPIDRPTSAGCNRLIQQGAKLVTGAGDILDEMNMLFVPAPKVSLAAEAVAVGVDEEAILRICEGGDLSLDDIIAGTGLTAPKASATLLSLEMRRLVKRLPGPRFARLQ